MIAGLSSPEQVSDMEVALGCSQDDVVGFQVQIRHLLLQGGGRQATAFDRVYMARLLLLLREREKKKRERERWSDRQTYR